MDFVSTVQTITWFRDRYREGALAIKPPFQRKPVWADRQKCYLIESILMGLPVPEIYIQQTINSEGNAIYAVVDGQQRIRTVLQFIGSETDPNEAEHNKFQLDKLEITSRYRDISFADLLEPKKKEFYGYNIAVRFLNTDRDEDVRDMFKRLNKFLTPLNPQELRNATYTGPFVGLVETLADDDYWTENRIFTPAFIRRMRDLEFVSELVIGVLHGPQGGRAADIDEYYIQYEDYETEFPEQKRAKRTYDRTLEIIKELFPSIKDFRWGNRTDFYTLFIAIASLLREGKKPPKKLDRMKNELIKFGSNVNKRLGDENFKATKDAIDYVRAVEKGANDKLRRAARHEVMTQLVEPFFSSK